MRDAGGAGHGRLRRLRRVVVRAGGTVALAGLLRRHRRRRCGREIAELGGRVLDGPQDTPHGRMVAAIDDQGAVFLLCQPTRSEN